MKKIVFSTLAVINDRFQKKTAAKPLKLQNPRLGRTTSASKPPYLTKTHPLNTHRPQMR